MLAVTAPNPTRVIPRPESSGLLSQVTLVAHHMGVCGDLRVIAINLFREGGSCAYQDGGRARPVHAGADLSTGRRSLPMPSAERFCWTNAAVLDTVRWAKAAVGACRPSDWKITKESEATSPHDHVPLPDLLRTHVRHGRIGIDAPDRGGIFCLGSDRDRANGLRITCVEAAKRKVEGP